MKLPWTGSDKRKPSASGGLVTSIGVGINSTAMTVVTSGGGPTRNPGRPNLTVTRMDEGPLQPRSGRFKLDR
ncbi:MAG: hypothetical protein ACJAZO_004236 [Myxococcota bacterium]